MTLTSGSNIRGTLYYKGKSTPHKATLYYFDNGDIIIETESDVAKKLHFTAMNISSRVANTQRQIFLPSGDMFTTNDNDAVDEMIKNFSPQQKNTIDSLLYYLESHIGAITALVAVSIVAVFIFIKFLFPAIVTHIAYSIPIRTLHLISEKPSSILITSSLQQHSYRTRIYMLLMHNSENLLKPYPRGRIIPLV